MSDIPKLNPVTIVRFIGDRKSAVTSTGKTVYRHTKLWMGKEYKWVYCAGFGSHFIYHDPDFDQKAGEWPKGRKFVGRWTPMCSCGSPAAIYGSRAYGDFSSPTTKADSTKAGQMLMCKHMVDYGVHMDGAHD
jgi:hypothetical protein